jgi:colanic acid/amylovoran biosynthesis glycosyltransferase
MARTDTTELWIGYLTSQYPATSHTFISREVAALRGLGVALDTFSIRLPTSAELKDDAIAAESRDTFTVLQLPETRIVGAQLATLLTDPIGYFRTLGLALGHRPPGLRGFGLSLGHFAEAIVLARELRRRGITRLHNHFANSAATVGYLATRMLKMPWSFTMHGISETDYPAGLLLGRKIEAADFVACVSYFGRAQAMRLVTPDHWPKLHVVRCGLPLSDLPGYAASDAAMRLMAVGRLSPEKGQAGLLEAFAAVSRDHDGIELVLVGDGPEAERLRAQAGELGIAERVRFAGRLSEQDTLRQIAAADILVLPSFMEGLPIVLMEAMAMGTAVIASRVAGIPELVEDEKSGLLFTPSDWDALAECIRRLVDDAGLREKLAERGRTVVAAEYDINRSAERLRELFGC